MTNINLSNITLCAIVLDELNNPAGGIADFLHSHLPFVTDAVVVDSGSMDGTREVLEEMKKEYSHLRVLDRNFIGYAEVRNEGLIEVKTPYALVLDPDERITQDDFASIGELIIEYPKAAGFNFMIKNFAPGMEYGSSKDLHNPRLFRTDKKFFYKNIKKNWGEWLYIKDSVPVYYGLCVETDIIIKHFRADAMTKQTCWYGMLQMGDLSKAPSETIGFKDWKKFNTKRLEYHFGLDNYEFRVPENTGIDSGGRNDK